MAKRDEGETKERAIFSLWESELDKCSPELKQRVKRVVDAQLQVVLGFWQIPRVPKAIREEGTRRNPTLLGTAYQHWATSAHLERDPETTNTGNVSLTEAEAFLYPWRCYLYRHHLNAHHRDPTASLLDDSMEKMSPFAWSHEVVRNLIFGVLREIRCPTAEDPVYQQRRAMIRMETERKRRSREAKQREAEERKRLLVASAPPPSTQASSSQLPRSASTPDVPISQRVGLPVVSQGSMPSQLDASPLLPPSPTSPDVSTEEMSGEEEPLPPPPARSVRLPVSVDVLNLYWTPQTTSSQRDEIQFSAEPYVPPSKRRRTNRR
jgi:hypothetical protein